jgi:cytochrome oxidase Cu insertion factor (SCO1/SenC/PrrC family)
MILAARIAAPAPVSAFTLKTPDGRPVTLGSLKGKIVVIIFGSSGAAGA